MDDTTRDKLKEHAESQPRDEQGHFIAEKDETRESFSKTTKTPHITEHTETKGIINDLDKLVHIAEDKQDDDAILDIKFTNPLHRIIEILQDIKKHQATTISLRFTIPLIALPIALFVFFQLGRAQTSCNTYDTTSFGTLKQVSVLEPRDKNHFYTPLLNLIPFYTPISDPKTAIARTRSVLVTPEGDTITLVHKTSVDTTSFNNAQVFVTGLMNSCHNTLTVEFPENISTL